MAYITVTQLKRHLEIPESDTDADTYLAELVERTTAVLDHYLGRSFAASTVTDEEHEYPGSVIWLPTTGVTVTAVKVKAYRTDEWIELDPISYFWQSNGRLSLGLRYAYVAVSYSTAGTQAKLLEQAALEVASNLYRSSGETGAISSEKNGDLTRTYVVSKDTVSASTLSLLDSLRVRNV